MYEKYAEHLCLEERLISPEQGGVWIFADRRDAAYASHFAAIPNCVAPRSNDFSGFSKCRDFFSQFPYAIIVPQNDERWAEIVSAVREYIQNTPVLVPSKQRFKGCRTVEELINKHGGKAIPEMLIDPTELPVYGLLDIADVVETDLSQVKRSLSGIYELNRVTGGFLMGDVSIWTGKRGEGKSTFLSQTLLDAIDDGFKVCAYSGELSAARFKQWLYVQAAGPHHIASKVNSESGRTMYSANPMAHKQINQWLKGKLFLYDLRINTAHDARGILRLFEYAARRYGCKVFLVDNIMTAKFAGTSDANFYREQSSFVGSLVEFAIKFQAHVHIVAHPKKTQGKISDSDDVSGISDITNRAGNVFSLARLEDGDAQAKNFDSVISVLKNREYGERAQIALCFEPKSRRYFKAFGGNPDRKYGWDYEPEQASM